jgi:hypothetical protein
MIEIDTNVKRPVTLPQHRVAGQFFKSGCSVAPAAPRCLNTPWPTPVAKAAEQGEPLSLYLRRLSRLPSVTGARNAARAMGIPSRSKD